MSSVQFCELIDVAASSQHVSMQQLTRSAEQMLPLSSIKAAMLTGGGALYTALFAAAEQGAGDPNGRHEVF